MSAAEKRDPVPPAAALRLLVANLTSNPLLKMTPGGPALLATLATLIEWVGYVEAQLDQLGAHAAAIDARMDYRRDILPQQIREQLERLLSVASREGQLEAPIADQARPGGPTDEERRRALYDLATFNSMR